MSSKEIFLPYAVVAMSAMKELEKIEQRLKDSANGENKMILLKQKAGLKHLIDRCFRLTGDFIPVHVSRIAKEHCVTNNLGDIFNIGWGNQTKFEKKKNRKECSLKHEHKIPVKSLIQKLRKAETIEDVLNIFESQEIVWIHKDEDRKLPKSNRPNPDEEYAKAGIDVIKNPHSIGHLFR